MLLALPTSGFISAASSTESYTLNNPGVNGTNGKFLKPSEIEAIYPAMSSAAEAAIVQVIPVCPVNVDGVWYKAEEITRFNGQRLHFTEDKAGSLFAFTDAKAMEAFLETEFGPIFDPVLSAGSNIPLTNESELFEDWWYSGRVKIVLPYEQFPDLAILGWNDCISSAKISTSAPVTLWEDIYFGGNTFTMVPGSNHSMLSLEGWNDRASAVS